MRKLKKVKARLRINCLTLLIGWILIFSFSSFTTAQEAMVASTSLIGAIAKAAGAKKVRVMTPSEIRHPPEYDLKPSDLLKFEGAKVVIYGGYERMVPKLLETSRNKNIIAIQIDTGTSPENLILQARKIAKVLKTEREEQVWEASFLEKLRELQKKITPFSGKRSIVHRFAQPFAQWAGLTIVQIIHPGELTPRVVSDAIANNPDLVVDILHFPIAKVIAENAKCKYIQVINFPGVGNTQTLEDVFEYNTAQLLKVFH